MFAKGTTAVSVSPMGRKGFYKYNTRPVPIINPLPFPDRFTKYSGNLFDVISAIFDANQIIRSYG